MAKSEKYIQKQKDKFAKQINETQRFSEVYLMAQKKGDLDILADFLGETEKRVEFLEEMWMSSIKDRKSLFKYASEIGIQELSERYTPELGMKLKSMYDEGTIKFLDVFSLVNINDGVSKEGKTIEEYNFQKAEQAKNISYLLDVFSDPDFEVGIHRTGGYIKGDEIKSKGLYLTGDLSSGYVNSIENEDIKTSLERNVSFYTGNPGLAVAQVCSGGHYKNYMKSEQSDIMLISIPKRDVESEALTKDFVKYDDGTQPTLDPKYVLGYVTVNNKDNSISSIHSDYKPKEKISPKLALAQLKNGVEGIVKDQEYTSIKSRFFSFLDKILGKNKNNKQSSRDDDMTI